MVCFHNRYDLGDKDHGFAFEDYDSWAEFEAGILKKNPGAIIHPIFLYDHSGITINTTGFSCQWDSGQIGFIFCTKEKAVHEWGKRNCTPKVRAWPKST